MIFSLFYRGLFGASTNDHTNEIHSAHALVDDEFCLKWTATIVHNLICEEAQHSTQTKPVIDQHPCGLDIDNCISELNPLLYHFIVTLSIIFCF